MQKQKRLAGRRIRKAQRAARRQQELFWAQVRGARRGARRARRALANVGTAAAGASVAFQKFGAALRDLPGGKSPAQLNLAPVAQGSDQEESS